MDNIRQGQNNQESEWIEKVIEIKRTSKKTKGGNQIRFTALVVVGDGKGKAGFVLGKAKDVGSAIRKGMNEARRRLVEIPLEGSTISRLIKIKFKASLVMLKPARPGTGLIAGGVIRAIAEAAGIKDLTAKILGSSNKSANTQAVFKGFSELKVNG